MESLIGSKFPPGFRFHPTDEELFMFYLKRKVMGKSLGPQMMSEVDVYRFAPWELPAKAYLNKDLNWFFLCPRSKKYPTGGARANRATELGYWKSTGIDRTVHYKNRPVGKIKTLIFHRGKAPKGDRTDWVMHEYRLEDKILLDQGVAQDSYVICKIYEKSGLGPKNGEHYGAPFVEEEWNSDDDDYTSKSNPGLTLNPEGTHTQPPLVIDSPNGSNITTTRVYHTSVDLNPSAPLVLPQPSLPPMEGLPPIETEEDELDRLLAMFEGDGNQVALTEDENFNGLDDLTGGGTLASGEDIDWSSYLTNDCYLELDDLNG